MLLGLSGLVRWLGGAVSIVSGGVPLGGRVVRAPSRSAGVGRRAGFAAVVVLALAAAGGCVGGEKTNGLERKSAAEVQQAAAAALRNTKFVRVTGMGLGADQAAVFDVRLQDKLSNITGTLAGSQFEIITVGEDLYLKGEQAAWQALQAPPPVQGFAGRWVQLSSQQVNLAVVSVDSLVALVSDNAWRGSTVQQASLDGKKVVVLSRQDGSRLTVANAGLAYPVRIENKPNGSQVNFTEYGLDSRIAAPADALSNAFTTGESSWLGAIKKLSESMNDVFVSAPVYITPAALAALADRLRGCSRELARIGPPTDRLQPANALAGQACARYDEGAQCFTTAADIGTPLAGSDADRRFTAAMDCGFASSDAGTALGDAVNKGDQIKSQVS